MKKQILALSSLLIFASIFFTSCAKDKCTRTNSYTIMNPVYMDYETFRSSVGNESIRSVENPGKIYLYKDYFFMNEIRKGVHVYDISDPANPTKVSFIKILGNVDIAIKDDVLIADSFMDLVTIDISDPLNAKEISRTNEAFQPNWQNGILTNTAEKTVVVDWVGQEITEETECNAEWFGGTFFNTGGFLNDFDQTAESAPTGATGAAPGGSGQGGSFARFTIVGNHLYTIDNRNLYAYNITFPSNPVSEGEGVHIGWNIETIYPYKDHLFIGSQSGMFVYDISNPSTPTYTSDIQHFRACDPVVVEGDYAYVTLRNGSECQGFNNQLDVINISNVSDPILEKSYDMTNPHGLGIDDGVLFICDGSDGLKIYDAEDPLDLKMVRQYNDIIAIDVIPADKILFMVSTEGFKIYDYSSVSKIRLLSSIGTND